MALTCVVTIGRYPELFERMEALRGWRSRALFLREATLWAMDNGFVPAPCRHPMRSRYFIQSDVEICQECRTRIVDNEPRP